MSHFFLYLLLVIKNKKAESFGFYLSHILCFSAYSNHLAIAALLDSLTMFLASAV